VQVIQLATTEVAGDNLSDADEDEDEEATTYAFDLPFEGPSRSAAFTTMLDNAQSEIDKLKDCLSSAEVLRRDCHVQIAECARTDLSAIREHAATCFGCRRRRRRDLRLAHRKKKACGI
jgi:hypothetical protein